MSEARFEEEVSVEAFQSFLKKYKFVSIHDLMKGRGDAALCFDDGYEDVFTLSFPILKEMNIPFTLFLNSAALDTPGFLSSESVKSMIASGLCSLGSHGVHHIDLDKMTFEEAREELIESKTDLERLFSVEVLDYAYPHGIYTQEILRFLKKNRVFTYAFSVSKAHVNPFSKRFKIPRINIDGANISSKA